MFKKNSHFRICIFPWILYAVAAVLTVFFIVNKLIFYPEILSLTSTLLFALLGLVAGAVVILYTKKNINSKRQFLDLQNSMMFCWYACVFVLFTVTSYSWTYLVSLPVSTACISYMALYLPHAIGIRVEIQKQLQA